MESSASNSRSRRDTIRWASGLGVATLVLPVAAHASSSADAQFAAIDPAWTLSDLEVRADNTPTATYCFVRLQTTQEVQFVIRWYRLDGSTYTLLASSDPVIPPFGGSGPYLFDSGLIVSGVIFTTATYAARVFLNGSTTTFVAEISGIFPPA